MISYQNTSVNTFFSSATAHVPQVQLRERTHDEVEAIKSVSKILIHHKSKRQSLSYALLNIICSRENKYGSCITKQQTFAREAFSFGYQTNKTSINTLSVKRSLSLLKQHGLITFERSSKSKRSVNRTKATELGMDLYWFIIRKNSWTTQIKLSTLSVHNFCENKKIIPQTQKNDTSNTPKIEKNDTSNIKSINIKKDINMGEAGCSKIEQLPGSHISCSSSDTHIFNEEQDAILTDALKPFRLLPGDARIVTDRIMTVINQPGFKSDSIEMFRWAANLSVKNIAEQYYWDARN